MIPIGTPIGVNDRHGNPVHIGDRMRFDEKEWGSRDCEFTVTFERGEVQGLGGVYAFPQWCEIIKPWDADILKPPKRHIEFECKIGADSMADLADILSETARDIDTGMIGEKRVRGGASGGMDATIKVNDGVTHDSYMIELGKYLAAKKAEKHEDTSKV